MRITEQKNRAYYKVFNILHIRQMEAKSYIPAQNPTATINSSALSPPASASRPKPHSRIRARAPNRGLRTKSLAANFISASHHRRTFSVRKKVVNPIDRSPPARSPRNPSNTLATHKSTMAADEPAACPVDHHARAAWLEKAKQAGGGSAAPPHPLPATPAAPTPAPAPLASSDGCDSSKLDQSPPQQQQQSRSAAILGYLGLGQEREVSTIPRALPGTAAAAADEKERKPANNEQETAADKASGNWVYPSEEMFFNAMKRKKFDPRAEDMRSIVPIHNAVNERAWKEIKEWEEGRGAQRYVLCPGKRDASVVVVFTDACCLAAVAPS